MNWLEEIKCLVHSCWKSALKALNIECTFDVDFHIHITNKTA